MLDVTPANDGIRPDDSQRMPNIRKQSIEAGQYHPVEGVEAGPLRLGAPKDDDLPPQDQILGFK